MGKTVQGAEIGPAVVIAVQMIGSAAAEALLAEALAAVLVVIAAAVEIAAAAAECRRKSLAKALAR